MPRGKKGQYALAADGNGGLAPALADGSGSGVSSVLGVSQGHIGPETALRALQWFDARTDGWLRIIPAGDGKQGYAKWKFTSGQWRGYYVMYVGPAAAMSERIIGLAGKLGAVDRGEKRPALDQYGGDGWEAA